MVKTRIITTIFQSKVESSLSYWSELKVRGTKISKMLAFVIKFSIRQRRFFIIIVKSKHLSVSQYKKNIQITEVWMCEIESP